jgi:AAA family ATP:ADP antiporter
MLPDSAETAMETSVSRTGEQHRTALAAATFFLLLCSYYVLRPVRETMAVLTGPDRVPWLFTGTFVATLAVVPLFGWLVRRVPRDWLIPAVYGPMIACLAGFYVVFRAGPTTVSAAAFFIWLSLFNLLVTSLFWSRVGDAFTTEQARRRYGYITAGGTAGAVTGPALTTLLAERVSTASLLLVSMGLLLFAGGSLLFLRPPSDVSASPSQRPIGGSVLAGIAQTFRDPLLAALAGLVICYSSISTVLYQEMTGIVGKAYADAGARTAYFARIDLSVNLLSLALQLLATRFLLRSWRLGWCLGLVPAVMLLGLVGVGVAPTAGLFAVVQVLHRAGEFALSKPSREVLFTTVDAENRYKAKNFIDTAVYRTNDAASIWLTTAVRSLGGNAIWIVALPVTMAWLLLSWSTGRRYDQRASNAAADPSANSDAGGQPETPPSRA